MRFAAILGAVLALGTAIPVLSFERPQPLAPPQRVPAEIVVKLRPGASPDSAGLASLGSRYEVVSAVPLLASAWSTAETAERDGRAPEAAAALAPALAEGLARTYRIRLGRTADLDGVLRAYRSDPEVEYAEPNLVLRALWTPNDPYFASQGAWGQAHGDLYGLHLTRCPSAWDVSRGHGVVVAVIDSGLDLAHPDIDGNVWTNEKEIPGNGIDDDGNGFRDDVHGWDFVEYDAVPQDQHGHGTHVAGTIAAEGNNGLGIVGVAPEARILPLRGLDASGSGNAFGLASAILYAVDNGADVVNASWGASGASVVVEDAVRYAHARGVVFVAAAGNAALDVLGFTPASVTEAVTVAASDPQDRAAAFTNRGLGIDVTAPGTGILSLRAPGTDFYGDGTHIVAGQYYWSNGTSMAAPHVSGAAALLLAAFPNMSVDEVRDRLAHGAQDLGPANPTLVGRLGGGRLDAARSLSLDLPAPSLTVSGTVVDRQGQPIAAAVVELGEMGSRRTHTQGDGTYTFTRLRPGARYSVGASRLGFEFTPALNGYRPLTASAAHQTFVGVQRWVTDIADSAFAAGWVSTSIATDAQSRPHIAYFIDFLYDLRYSWWTGHRWDIHTVDSSNALGGIFTALAFDSNGRRHLSFLNWDGVSAGPRLRYAYGGDFGWAFEDVDLSNVNFHIRLAVDAARRPHITYTDNGLHQLKYARKTASGWQVEAVNPGEKMGYCQGMALDSQGRPHVVYENIDFASPSLGLNHAVRVGDTWQTSRIEGYGPYTNCALAIDAQDRVHVAYGRAAIGQFTLTYAVANGTGWNRETVAPNLQLAFGLNLEVAAGTPHLVAHAPSVGLVHGLRTPSGWRLSPIHAGNAGYFNDTALDTQGRMHVSYYDYEHGYLAYARAAQITDPPGAPPTVAFTYPANGAFLLGPVVVAAAAQAPLGITRVEFLVDGVPRHVDSAAPYTFDWNASEGGTTSHVLTARAIDTAGAAATHAIQVWGVNVITSK